MYYIEKTQNIPLQAIISFPNPKKKRTGHIPNSSLRECPKMTRFTREEIQRAHSNCPRGTLVSVAAAMRVGLAEVDPTVSAILR